ncbi:hypothetical protein ACFY3O_27140 [Streptomyces sp. NPDC001046]|uniref:hypothetical protein n=1 Tax=Streptomyces sp. NPDC001046 TaxID=3364543 RepID=UPI003684ADE1
MFRGETARIVVTVLAAALLALQLFAPAPSFASAHTGSEPQAKAGLGTTSPGTSPGPGNTPAGPAPRDETASCRTAPAGDPTGPLRTRARSHPADRAPSASGRPLPRLLTRAATQPSGPATARTSRPPVTHHTPATLQVFRC